MTTSSQTRELQPVISNIPQPAGPITGANQAMPLSNDAPFIPADGALPLGRRLVVLVPDMDVDEASLATRIWSMAAPRHMQVLFLGTLRHEQERYRARRRLALIAAITRDRATHVESQLVLSADSLAAALAVCQPGDIFVCHSEQMVSSWKSKPIPLAQKLLSVVNAPIYVLSGFYPNLGNEGPNWMRALTWLPPMLLVIVGFAVQVRLAQATSGWLQTAVLGLSVIAEFVLVAAWERYLGNLL
jgi:hypothetical protein